MGRPSFHHHLLVATTLLCSNSLCSIAWSQVDDPFAGKDPALFGSVRDAERDPLVMTFHVKDNSGNPVGGARIRGPGIARPLLTNSDGTVRWNADANQLTRWSERTQGRLRFFAVPPEDSLLLGVSQSVQLTELRDRRTIVFDTQPGVRLIGRVVGRTDKKPVAEVTVVIDPNDGSSEFKRLETSTDEQGIWSVVVPRADVMVSVRGRRDGYLLEDAANSRINDARELVIPADKTQVQIADFELEQIAPINVVVADANGRTVPTAVVRAYRQVWLDENIPIWEKITREIRVDQQGNASLPVIEASWDIAMVEATGQRDGSPVHGRASARSNVSEPIPVVVQGLGKIGGVLRRRGTTAASVEIVLYEAVQNQFGDWKAIRQLGEVVTKDRGIYVFEAPVGLHYIIATKERDSNGKQRIVHRTDHPTTSENYRVPDRDLSTLVGP